MADDRLITGSGTRNFFSTEMDAVKVPSSVLRASMPGMAQPGRLKTLVFFQRALWG